MRKTLALILSTVMLLCLISSALAEPAKIRYMTFEDADWQRFTTDFIAKFEAEHPDIKVQYEPTSYDECMTKIKTTIATGTAPDLFWCDAFLELVQKDVFEPLDDYVKKYNIDLSIYDQSLIDMCTYNGHLYALCGWSGMTAIYYNKAIFDQAGVPYPEEGWTWEDVSRIAPLLTSGEGADKVYALNFNLDWMGAIETLCWGNGARLFNEETYEVDGYMNSDKMVDALTWYTSFVKNGYAPSVTTLNAVGGSADELFKNGKLAMYYGFFGFISSLEANEGFDMNNLGVVCLPVGEAGMKPPVNTMFTSAMCIPKDSQYKEEAFQFLVERVSEETMLDFCSHGWATPSIPSIVEKINLMDNPLTYYFGDVLANPDKYEHPHPTGNYHPQYSDITENLVEAVTSIVIDDMDVREALNQATANVVKAMEKAAK